MTAEQPVIVRSVPLLAVGLAATILGAATLAFDDRWAAGLAALVIPLAIVASLFVKLHRRGTGRLAPHGHATAGVLLAVCAVLVVVALASANDWSARAGIAGDGIGAALIFAGLTRRARRDRRIRSA